MRRLLAVFQPKASRQTRRNGVVDGGDLIQPESVQAVITRGAAIGIHCTTDSVWPSLEVNPALPCMREPARAQNFTPTYNVLVGARRSIRGGEVG